MEKEKELLERKREIKLEIIQAQKSTEIVKSERKERTAKIVNNAETINNINNIINNITNNYITNNTIRITAIIKKLIHNL